MSGLSDHGLTLARKQAHGDPTAASQSCHRLWEEGDVHFSRTRSLNLRTPASVGVERGSNKEHTLDAY